MKSERSRSVSGVMAWWVGVGLVCFIMVVFFFFSSRRRHTRFDCDWSSDVCSSDLGDIATARAKYQEFLHLMAKADGGRPERSEERRVGKECRSRWSPYH